MAQVVIRNIDDDVVERLKARATAQLADWVPDRIGTVGMMLIPDEALAAAAMQIARRLDHPVYDCWRIQAVVATSLKLEVVMGIRKRRSDWSGRAPLQSPGRPPVAGRDERSRFWLAIAAGMSSEDAAVEAGVIRPDATLKEFQRFKRELRMVSPALLALKEPELSDDTAEANLKDAGRSELERLYEQRRVLNARIAELERRLGIARTE